MLLQASFGILDRSLMLPLHGEERYNPINAQGKDRTLLQGFLWDCGSVEVHV